jgi:hypothetical protein
MEVRQLVTLFTRRGLRQTIGISDSGCVMRHGKTAGKEGARIVVTDVLDNFCEVDVGHVARWRTIAT